MSMWFMLLSFVLALAVVVSGGIEMREASAACYRANKAGPGSGGSASGIR
jgi:hypothetical protein